jgi:hypothetical protein
VLRTCRQRCRRRRARRCWGGSRPCRRGSTWAGRKGGREGGEERREGRQGKGKATDEVWTIRKTRDAFRPSIHVLTTRKAVHKKVGPPSRFPPFQPPSPPPSPPYYLKVSLVQAHVLPNQVLEGGRDVIDEVVAEHQQGGGQEDDPSQGRGGLLHFS